MFEKMSFETILYNILHILKNELQYSASTDLVVTIPNRLSKKPQSPAVNSQSTSQTPSQQREWCKCGNPRHQFEVCWVFHPELRPPSYIASYST